MNNLKVAEQLRKDFKVPDKRFHWIKVRALAESRNWLELERFAKSKKSPIGYEVGTRVPAFFHIILYTS